MRIRSVMSWRAAVAGLFVFVSLATPSAPVRGQDEAPGGADREWRFIEKLEQDGMADLALRQLEQFAADFPQDPRASRALLRAAEGYRELGQSVGAAELYERLLRDFPASEEAPAAALARAELFTDAEQWDRAITAYRSLLESHPAAPQAEPALLGLAEALMAQREDQEARRLLGRLVGGRASDDVGSRALFDLALLDLRAGADSLATERFDAIHTRYPGRPIGAFGLLRAANLLEAREAPAAARARYERVLELFAEPVLRARAHLALAALVEADDPGLAAGHFRAVAEEGGTPDDVQNALLGLGRAALAMQEEKEAREAAQAFLARYPESPRGDRARLILALADLRPSRDAAVEALLALGEARDAEVAHEALATAGRALEDAGQHDRALEAWKRAERAAPDAARRAQALLEQARLANASQRPALAADLALAAHDAADTDDARATALLVAVRARIAAEQRAQAMELARRTATEHPLTEQATAAREELRRLERLAALDPAGAARALGELAQRQIEDPAERSLEVARIYRDRLGDAKAAVSTLGHALGQASTPEQRARIEIETARTHQQDALVRGLAGDREGASEALRAARTALTEAAARGGAEAGSQQARVMLIGLDLAEAARPDAPWSFDAERMPLLGAVGAAESVDLGSEALEATRRRLQTAREKAGEGKGEGAATKDQRAWVTWRWAEISGAPLDERVKEVRAALETKPSRDLDLALRVVLGQLLLEQEDAAGAARELARVVERDAAGELGLAARYALAEAHRSEKRYAQAGDLYAEYATVYPQTQRGQRALLLAGDCALFAGRGDEAVERYRHLLERYPGSVYEDDALYRMGTALQRTGRLEAAREPLLRLAQWTGSSEYRGRALALLASIEQAAGRPTEARAALERLVKEDPERAVQEHAWTRLARLALDAGDPAAALTRLDQARANAELDADALALQVEAASAKGDLALAAASLQSLSRAFPDAADAVAAARLHLAQAQRAAGRLDPARESAELALSEARAPEVKAHAHYELAMVHAQASRWADAKSAFEAAEKAAPSSDWAAEALFKLGQFHGSQNDDAASQKAFAALTARFPRSEHAVEALRGEARAWRQMGRYDRALELYHRILEEHPEVPGAEDVLSNIAYCHHEMGQYEVAIAAYRRVMPYLDEEGQAYAVFWIGDGLDKLGRHQEAATEFLRIPYLYANQGMLPVTAQLKAGEAYEKVPDPAAARSLYERVLRSHGPGSDWGREAQKRLDRLQAQSPQEGERGSR